MNATAPDQTTAADDRTARHLGMLQKLAQLGMHLATAAAEAASAQLAIAPPEPGAPLPNRGKSNPGLEFTRYCRTVQQLITLEARLAAGANLTKTTQNRAAAINDPRRAPLRRGLNIATEFRPDRKTLRREIEKNLDEKLAEDPGHEKAIYNLFMALCEEAGIKPDLGKIPDECLGFNIPHPGDEDESDPAQIDVHSDDFISYLRTGHPVPEILLRAQAKRAAGS